MSRIRSIHAGQWTDEDFVQMSFAARLLCIAIRNEADDRGIFEWKPVTLKMRLMPLDAVDMAALMAEMIDHKQVTRFTHEGREFGAIRNFMLYQRPKKPNYKHPIPDELRTYVGHGAPPAEPIDDDPPPVPDEFPTGGEEPPQRDIGVGEGVVGKGRKKEPYAFVGRVVKLNRADFDGWRKAYSAIPDLGAELRRIDDALASEGKVKGWFSAASAMLAAKHQRLSAAAPTSRPAITPLGVGG